MVNTINITVSISREFHDLAIQNKVSWAEAMRKGLSLTFAELGISEYDNSLNLYRKMDLFREQLEAKSQELEELKEKFSQMNAD